jgi:plastocyanin
MRSRMIIGLLLVPLVVGAGHAGEIRGTLRLSSSATEAAPAPNPYPGTVRALAAPRHAPRGLVTDAVIWIEGVPASAVGATAGPMPRLAQKDQSFVPRVLPVAIGTQVEFPNMDAIYHNVFSLSPVRRFDLGKYPRGQSRRVVFDKPGLVNVYCEIHSDMEGFIVVLPNHAFTQPDASGSFRLPSLPAGRYVLRMWHPDRPEVRRDVTVPATGTVTVEIAS